MKAPKRYNQSALAVLRRSSAFPTLEALAAEVGAKSKSTMQQIEAGRIEVSEDRLRAIARALGLSYLRVRAAYLTARREHLRSEAERVESELRELLSRAS